MRGLRIACGNGAGELAWENMSATRAGTLRLARASPHRLLNQQTDFQ